MKEAKETLTPEMKKMNPQWIITADKITMRTQDRTQTGTYKLDPTKTPGEIDLIPLEGPEKGLTMPGIYAIEGDTLKICFTGPQQVRPKEFKTIEDMPILMMVFQRDPGVKK
jgi:uncharacterized protein (TIGR03067 family)